MAISCEAKCGKSILLSFTLIHWLGGAAFVLLGASIILDPSKLTLFHFVTFDTFQREYGLYVAYGLLGLGALIFTISWIGCCGAAKENRCLLVLYFGLLLAVLTMELVGSALTLSYRGHWMTNLETRLKNTLLEHYGNHSSSEKYLTFSEALDYAQFKFACCGISDHTDYQYSKWRYRSRGFPEDKDSRELNAKYFNLVPPTCCVLKTSTQQPWVNSASSPMSTLQRETPFGTVEEEWQVPNIVNLTLCQLPKKLEDYQMRHIRGCYEHIKDWFNRESTILISAGFGTAALQLVGVFLTMYLFYRLNKDI